MRAIHFICVFTNGILKCAVCDLRTERRSAGLGVEDLSGWEITWYLTRSSDRAGVAHGWEEVCRGCLGGWRSTLGVQVRGLRSHGRGSPGAMQSFVTRWPSLVTASPQSSETCRYTLLWKGRACRIWATFNRWQFAHKKREIWGNTRLATCAWNKPWSLGDGSGQGSRGQLGLREPWV